MGKLFRKYFELASGATPLLISFAGVLLMVLWVFPSLPIGGEMIDLKLSYDLAAIQQAMLQYGAHGRAVYALASPTLDTLFPLLYVTFFAGLLYRFRPNEKLWLAAFVPLVAGIWDLCENAQITAMLMQYPELSVRQVAVASFFTSTKHVLSAVYEVAAVTFLLIFAARRVSRTTKS
ncbi:MAG: hypothetical protein WCK94_05015 [Comamonadaceae bacterium]|jgi:hypothetical protein